MRFESIREWQKVTLEKTAAAEKTSTVDLIIDLLLEWAENDYWNFIDEYAEKYNLILEPQEE